MKTLTDIGLVALGLVVGVVVGQLLQYNQINIQNIIKKIFNNYVLKKSLWTGQQQQFQ